MANLKPCPFCGGKGELQEQTVCIGHGAYVSEVYIRCSSCGATAKKIDNWTYSGKTIDRKWIAMNEWNRRTKVEVNFYDKEETYFNCTVQVLTNTVTGDVSVGWWKNGGNEDG